MARHLTGLDHAIIAVRDLEQAAATFRRLGFTLTPKGVHAEWGTANYCIMFEGDYFELLAAEGPGGLAERVRDFTATREGLMAMAWGSSDAVADCARLGLEPPGALSRAIEGETARFIAGPLPEGTTPGMSSFLCQHLTPGVLRQPGWTDHDNGALGMASITVLVAEPLEVMAGWDRMVGPAASTATDELVTVHTPHGLVFLCKPEDIEQLHPETETQTLPPPPAMMVLTLRVADTAAATRLLKGNGIAFDRDGSGNLHIPADQACGVIVEMVGRVSEP